MIKSETTRVVVRSDGVRSRVELDGQDVSGMLRAVSFRHVASGAPVVELELTALPVRVTADCVVRVADFAAPEVVERAILAALRLKYGAR